ncbi:MAG: Zn-dependent hydrolase [Gammaproteobacteria bacterium]|nr:Zn-dependent hydrolase [Gammaproteobacteria bacterium]MCY4340981.1 Zn-dependent hydrolase [Gammaproteobacteria bacterium]
MNSKLLDLRIQGERLWDALMAMAEIGATPKGGCNRQAMTDEDKAGRDLFTRWCEQAGATVAVDAIGNLFARREGRLPEAPPVMIGSHLDTQITGGKFDGVYGVLSGVEILRRLDEAGVETSHPIEVAVWTNEEGVRFAPAMMGSGVWSGALDLNRMYQATDSAGISLESELRRLGCKGQAPAEARPLKAAFEAHIEQGPILEAKGCQIGVVTGAQGVRWYDLDLTGEPCHAGPTPMEMRRDPVAGLLPLLGHCYDLAARHAPWGRATIGDIGAQPGSRNTVAEKAHAKIDMRHPETVVLDQMEQSLRASVAEACESGKLQGSLGEVFRMPVTEFAPECVQAVRQAAKRLNYRHMDIVSGAGHDSVNLAAVAPAGMIFVPCENGISHNEEESAKPEDLEAGANVLLQAVLSMAC